MSFAATAAVPAATAATTDGFRLPGLRYERQPERIASGRDPRIANH